MRYFIELAYNGTRFVGWQNQPNGISVQSRIENALQLILRHPPLSILGCGRTDTGVHARYYVAHFDFEGALPEQFLLRFNKLVGNDIAIQRVAPVASDAHARFDAFSRSYEYHLTAEKDVFQQESVWHFPKMTQLDFDKMQKCAQLLTQYTDFTAFCKTNSDAKTMLCTLSRAEWIFDAEGKKAVFYISANRFLRGMVRLIVGTCINVGLGQTSLDEVKFALDNQTTLKKSYSVPPQGLALTEVKYPFTF